MDMTPYAKLLADEKARLTEELLTVARYNESADEWIAIPDPSDITSADTNVEADGVEDWNTRRAIVANLTTRYRNINRALGKITTGTYGLCEISGAPVEQDRLLANPAARTCKAHMHDEGSLTL